MRPVPGILEAHTLLGANSVIVLDKGLPDEKPPVGTPFVDDTVMLSVAIR